MLLRGVVIGNAGQVVESGAGQRPFHRAVHLPAVQPFTAEERVLTILHRRFQHEHTLQVYAAAFNIIYNTTYRKKVCIT